MVQNVSHPQSNRWYAINSLRHHRTVLVMMIVLGITLVMFTFRKIESVDWMLLAKAVVHTAYRITAAYAIALVLAVFLGLLVAWSPFADYLFPVFDVLQNIPSFALIPMFIFLFGYSDEMIILFAVASILWPILFAVLTAVKNAHPSLNDAATIFGAVGWKRINYYLAPLSLPAILTGSIVGIAIGWETVIGAEIITNVEGFGDFIREASVNGVSQEMVIGTVSILLMVFVLNRLVWAPLLDESTRRFSE